MGVLKGLRVERARHTQCSSEGAAPDGGIHTRARVMHPRTPTRQDRLLVCDEGTALIHHSQEGGPWGTRAASHARSNGFHPTPLLVFQDAVGLDVDLGAGELGREAVSYTHLTLPTIYSV